MLSQRSSKEERTRSDPFIKLSLEETKAFEYETKYALVITISDYSKTREIEGESGMCDLP